MDFAATQTFLAAQKIDVWLSYDFRGGNPIFAALLPGQRWTTRRAMVVVPARGSPSVIVHNIDAPQFKDCGMASVIYNDWKGWQRAMRSATEGANRVAMEYSPMGELPAASFADAGIVEFVRSLGVEVVSSEDAVQISVARWSADALARHREASRLTAEVKDAAFALIRDRIAVGEAVNELDVQRLILGRFKVLRLDPDHPPIVGCNGNSGDPHFEVSRENPAPIRRGDWILIDLWARFPGNENIFADITWMGFCGPRVPDEYQNVWNTVKGARDAALKRVTDAWRANRPVHGWQLDDAARDVVLAANLGHGLRHRTGHSLSPGTKVHGLGANLDNFETHDTRRILPGTGFTIEPALYVPGGHDGAGFGCRSEVNVYVDAINGPVLTSPIQDEVLLLAAS